MTDRAFCFCLALAILMVSDVAISPDDSEGVVLAKVMELAKEIRPGDKKRVKTGVKTPINRRPGWGPGGSVVCWRMLAFLGAGDARRKRDAAGGGGAVGGFQGGGVMVCRGWLGGGDPAAICGGNSAVFNQLLTTFHVVAMVWRLTVFWLCSKGDPRRALPGR